MTGKEASIISVTYYTFLSGIITKAEICSSQGDQKSKNSGEIHSVNLNKK